MSEEIRFRLLTVDDYLIFHALRLRACKEEPSAFCEAYEELVELPPEQCKRHFDNGWVAGAFVDRQLVGIAGLFRHKGMKLQHKGTVWGVYVAPEARGRGISRRCIEMVIDEAKRAGIELVHLSTDVDNAVSVGLYKSLGFEPWGIEKHIAKLPDRYIDDVVMTKYLT